MTTGVAHPMAPRPYRVRERWRETHDTVTLALDPLSGAPMAYRPGQFNMLYQFGVGEVPISISGEDRPGQPLLHTIRSVGAVSEALCQLRTGDVLGVRGPFGSSWGAEEAEGSDLVLVAGGIGLAPLRSALHYALARRPHFGRLVLLVGARAPEEVVFGRELDRLRARDDVVVELTVDRAGPGWEHHVGVVTQLLPLVDFDTDRATFMVCGPEVMMRFAAAAILARGVAPDRIRVSLERNMRCAIGWCGHCQLGPEFVCADGPVRSWASAEPLLAVKER